MKEQYFKEIITACHTAMENLVLGNTQEAYKGLNTIINKYSQPLTLEEIKREVKQPKVERLYSEDGKRVLEIHYGEFGNVTGLEIKGEVRTGYGTKQVVKQGEVRGESEVTEETIRSLIYAYTDCNLEGDVTGVDAAANSIFRRFAPLQQELSAARKEIAELKRMEKEIAELKRMENTNNNLMLSGEKRGHDKAKEHYETEINKLREEIERLKQLK